MLIACLCTTYLLVPTTTNAQTVNQEILCQKWHLSKYSYLLFSIAPEVIEQDDFLHLNEDSTFKSISEGVYEEGVWRLNQTKKSLHLFGSLESGELVFLIEKLTQDELVLVLDKPEEYDAEHFKIHFKS